MKNPLVSVIIVTLNNKEWLDKCLIALNEQVYRRIQIIVIDNGSDDGTDKLMKSDYSKIEFYSTGSNLGFGKAANVALKKAKGKYALIYNDDAICDKNFIKLLVKKMEADPNIGAVQGTILFTDRKNILESAGAFLTHTGILIKDFGVPFIPEKATEKKVFNTNLPMIRMSVLEKIGLFDEDYFLYFEEADLCWRIWLAGFTAVYYPDALIYHARGITTKKLKAPIVIESTFKNRINSLLKNLELVSLIWLMPIHWIMCLAGIILYLIRGKPYGSIAILKAILWNFMNLRHTLKKRKVIQKKRKITDKNLFPVIMKPMRLSYLTDMALDYLKQW